MTHARSLALAAVVMCGGAAGAEPVPLVGYGWGEKVGWIALDISLTYPAVDRAMAGDAFLSGYIRSEKVGWIHLGSGTPAGGVQYSNTTSLDYGVNRDGLWLSGFGWGEKIGWVDFSRNPAASQPGVRILADGSLQGAAWSRTCGWILFEIERLRLRNDDGGATIRVLLDTARQTPIQGFQFGVGHGNAATQIAAVEQGAALGAFDVTGGGFWAFQIHTTPPGFAVQCVIDLNTFLTLPADVGDQEIARVTYASSDPAVAADNACLEGVFGLGSDIAVTYAGMSLIPATYPRCAAVSILPGGTAVGGFDLIRGGEGGSFTMGKAFAGARTALQAQFPDAVFRSADRISWEFLRTLRFFVLPVISNDVDGILPLTDEESAALHAYVACGGNLLLLGDNEVTAGVTQKNVFGLFEMACGGLIRDYVQAAVTNTTHPVTSGVTTVKQYNVGAITVLNGATQLARNSQGTALAVLDAQAMNPASGRIVFASDVNSFWSTAELGYQGRLDANMRLFENIVNYLMTWEPPDCTVPVIRDIRLTTTTDGTELTIFGECFGADSGVVDLNGVPIDPALVVEWSDDRIVVETPATLPDASVEVTTAGGTPSAPVDADVYSECTPLSVVITNPVDSSQTAQFVTTEGASVYFEAQASTDAQAHVEDVLWHFGDTAVIYRGTEVLHVFESQGTYTVTVVAADRCFIDEVWRGRTASATLQVRVDNAKPACGWIAAEPSFPTVCDVVQFTGQFSDGSPAPDTHALSWDFGDGTVLEGPGTGQIVTHRYGSDGTYTVKFTCTDSRGASCQSVRTIQVANDTPAVSWRVTTPQPLLAGVAVAFEGRFVDRCAAPYTYLWVFGDGTSLAGTLAPSHTYAQCGDYVVEFRVTDGAGRTGSVRRTIRIESPPTAAFVCPAAVEEGTVVAFDASGSSDGCFGIAEYEWDFGDGGRATTTSPIVRHRYDNNKAANAPYTIALTVRDTAGLTDLVSRAMVVTNTPPRVVDISADRSCAGETATFLAAGFDLSRSDCRALAYSWTFVWAGGTQNPSGNPVAFAIPANCTQLTITVVATDPDQAASAPYTTPFPTGPCVVTAGLSCPGPVDEGQELVFSAATSSASRTEIVKYVWDFGDGTSGLGAVVKHTYCRDGQYAVTVTVYDALGHTDTASCTVTVDNVPPVASIGGPRQACLGQPVAFYAAAADPGCDQMAFTWNVVPQAACAGAGDVFTCTFAAVGKHQVTVQVSDGQATDMATLEVDVINEPQCWPPVPQCGIANVGEVKEGDIVTFTGAGSLPGGGTIDYYMWTFGDGTNSGWRSAVNGAVADEPHVYRDNGVYHAVLTIVNSYGLRASCSLDVPVANVSPVADAGPDREVMAGVSILFSGKFFDPGAGDTHRFLWDFGDGGVAREQESRHAFSAKGTYTVTFTVIDDDGGVGSDTATVTVGPRPPVVAVLPSVVTISTCQEEIAAQVWVRNPTDSPDTITLVVDGLSPLWFDLEATEVSLPAGGSRSLALRIHPGLCAGNAGVYPFSITGQASVSGLATIARATLNIVDSPIIVPGTLSPGDGITLATTTVVFTWRTVAPSTTAVHYRLKGEEFFTVIDGGAGETTMHRVEVAGLQWGQTYEWYGISACCAGQAVAQTPLTTFQIQKGVTIARRSDECIPSDFGAAVALFVTNEDATLPHTVNLRVVSAPEELASFGFSANPITVAADQTASVALRMDARAGVPGVTYLVTVEASLAGGGPVSHTVVPVEVCPPNVDFTFIQVSRNIYELVNTFRLTNNGDPLTAVENGPIVVRAGAGFSDEELIFLDGTQFALPAGQWVEFRVQHVGPRGLGRDGTLVAAACGVEQVLFTDFGCPGNSDIYCVNKQDTVLCRRVIDWYTDDLPGGVRTIPFRLPLGFARADIGDARLLIRFGLVFVREVYPNHSLSFALNGIPLGPPLRNIVPEGLYAFRLDRDQFVLPADTETSALNQLAITVDAPQGKPFLETVDVKIEVPLDSFNLCLCAVSQLDADNYAAGLITSCGVDESELVPRITGVRMTDGAGGPETDSFCLDSNRDVHVCIDTYNPSWSAYQAELRYDIAELAPLPEAPLFEGASAVTYEPFGVFSLDWDWTLPGSADAREYGLRVELREPDPPGVLCFDCRGYEWVLHANVPDFDIAYAPDLLYVKQGSSNVFRIDVLSRCGFAGDVDLAVVPKPPLVQATFTKTPVPAGGWTRLTIATDPAMVLGRQYVEIQATGGGVVKRLTLPFEVTESRGSDLVFKGVTARSAGYSAVYAGETTEIRAVIVNQGDADYWGGQEIIFFYEKDSFARFVQSDILLLEVPRLAPGEEFSLPPWEEVYPIPNQRMHVMFRIVKDFPLFHYDNEIRNNDAFASFDVDPNPDLFLGCASALLRVLHYAGLSPATLARLEAIEDAISAIRWYSNAAALQDAWLREDDEAVIRTSEKVIVDGFLEYLGQSEDETVASMLGGLLGDALAFEDLKGCVPAFAQLEAAGIVSWANLLTMAIHHLFPALADGGEDGALIIVEGDVTFNIVLPAAKDGDTVQKDDKGSVQEWSLAGGKLLYVRGARPPDITLTANADGPVKLGVFFTKSDAAVDVNAIFPEATLPKGGTAEVVLDLAGHDYALAIDRNADGTPEATLACAHLKVRERNAPVLLTRTIAKVAVGHTLSQTIFAGRFDGEEPASFELTGDPPPPAGMAIDSGSGVLTWTPQPGDEGVHAIVIRVTDALGREDEDPYVVEVPGCGVTEIAVSPEVLWGQAIGMQTALRVTGVYLDGSWIDVTASSAGTTYETSDESVAAVSSEGVIEIKGRGAAEITVRHCELTARCAVWAMCFVRGDANASGNVNIADAISVCNYLYRHSNIPCLAAADCDDDGKVDLSDAIYLLYYQFKGGVQPRAPFPNCGPDGTPDELGCRYYPACQTCPQ